MVEVTTLVNMRILAVTGSKQLWPAAHKILPVNLNSNTLQAAFLNFIYPPAPWGCQPHISASDSVIVWSSPVINKVAKQGP